MPNNDKQIYLFDIKKKKVIAVDTDDAIDKLYNLEVRMPTKKELGKKQDIQSVIHQLSKIDNKIPLFDTYSENIYVIAKYNVYYRVVYQHYRFPDKQILATISEKMNELEKNINKYTDANELILKKRQLRKYKLIIEFMNNFDIDVLFNTYMKVFYLYSPEAGKNITNCIRPSFIPQLRYINPYYTRSEIINMALNMEYKISDKYYEQAVGAGGSVVHRCA